ncbi:prevent-host-death family protein [Polynucleobacter paneuropaeus]|nr:prevent-host-death family protein [Polynucleobacter paneuropaeus]QWD48050.1 prevent-host-death family protein [Polynucleobacter paneuropaeus]
MEFLPTKLTATLAELREPDKLIAKAGNQPIAILDRNEILGYFVPKSAVEDKTLLTASDDQINAFLESKLPQISHVINDLKDR